MKIEIRNSQFGRRRFLGAVFAFLISSFGIAGCSAQKPITAATVHQTITTAIADAGTVAILAEQQYQSGAIPQTATNRTLINDLGNAYNKAKDIYQDVLSAEATANLATQAQLTACTPGPSGGQGANATSCISATQAASQAKANAAQKSATLENTVNALVTQTGSVKAIVKQ